MAILKTEALVLRTYDFRETSLLVNFFTHEFGKIKGILKGIRMDPRKFNSTLEPFSCNEIIFYSSRNSEIHLVSQCDLLENFDSIRKSVNAVLFASYFMDLVDKVVPLEEKNALIYRLIVEALGKINEGFEPDKILRVFVIKLLNLAGFRPRLSGCVVCDCDVDEQVYFNVKRGGLICKACSENDIYSINVLKGTIASLLHMEKNGWQEALRLGLTGRIKEELASVIDNFMEFHLQIRPKSKQFLGVVS